MIDEWNMAELDRQPDEIGWVACYEYGVVLQVPACPLCSMDSLLCIVVVLLLIGLLPIMTKSIKIV